MFSDGPHDYVHFALAVLYIIAFLCGLLFSSQVGKGFLYIKGGTTSFKSRPLFIILFELITLGTQLLFDYFAMST